MSIETDGRLYSVEVGTSAQIVGKIMQYLLPDAVTVLDLTYGDGGFWSDEITRRLGISVTGVDADPSKGVRVADFTRLGFEDRTYDVVAFDPPYHTDRGKETSSVMAGKYGHYANLRELETAVRIGAREAWRLSTVGVIVKVQDYVHGSKFIEMTQWVREAIGQAPYQRIESYRRQKMLDGKWSDPQYSAYAVSATYLVFRHGSQAHRMRKRRHPTVASAQAAADGMRSLTSQGVAVTEIMSGSLAGVRKERRR